MKITDKEIPVTRPYMPPLKEYEANIASIWETRWLTHGGPLVRELEKKISKRLEVNDAVAFSNGHIALDCALRILKLKGEVITTPFTYLSTVNAIAMNGLTPVFCDIKEDCTLDETKLESLINENTCAIVPVHVYGFPCNYKEIERIARKHSLKVIYDAAHVFNVKIDGKGIATLGDMSMFSFHATKVFHTVEGGAICFNDLHYRDLLVSAKNFGMVGPEEAETIGLNGKMTETNAAMGLTNLNSIDWQIEQRKQLVLHYLERLKEVEGIKLFSWDHKNIEYNYAYFPIIFDDAILTITRDEIAAALEQRYRVKARRYFYPLVSDLKSYKEKYNSADTPNAKHISDNVLTLPLFVELTHDEVDYICDALQEILTGNYKRDKNA